MAFVVLFTSAGFTVASHSCGGEVVKTALSLGNTDISCGMENEDMVCETEEELKSNCCHNEFQQIQLDEEFTLKVNTENVNPQFLVSFLSVHFNPFQLEKLIADNFSDRAPPRLIRDIPLEVQSFLI